MTTKIFNPMTQYFIENGDTLELWWKDEVVQCWTVSAVPVDPPPIGSGIGLLLTLTHAE